MKQAPGPVGLYDPRNEHDSCGVAFVVDMHGRRSRDIVDKAIMALVNLEHRGAAGAEPKPGSAADPSVRETISQNVIGLRAAACLPRDPRR